MELVIITSIHTYLYTTNKQTINVLSVFHPHAPVQFPSSFYTHFIIIGNFVFVISFLDLPGRLF